MYNKIWEIELLLTDAGYSFFSAGTNGRVFVIRDPQDQHTVFFRENVEFNIFELVSCGIPYNSLYESTVKHLLNLKNKASDFGSYAYIDRDNIVLKNIVPDSVSAISFSRLVTHFFNEVDIIAEEFLLF